MTGVRRGTSTDFFPLTLPSPPTGERGIPIKLNKFFENTLSVIDF